MIQPCFKQRRTQLLQHYSGDCAILLPAAEEIARNADTTYPFRQNSDFLYLTGFNEPDALLLIVRKNQQSQHILFNRPRDIEMEIWNGRRAGQTGAVDDYGFDQAFSIAQLNDTILPYLDGIESLIYPMAQQPQFDRQVLGWIEQLRQKVRQGCKAPTQCIDVRQALHEMRLLKRPEELALMRHAAHVSSLAHNRTMQAAPRSDYEYQLEAELLHCFVQHGCRAPAYESIVAAGENGCILHYNSNNQRIQPQDLILIDAGAEYQGYAADITRTFPAKGHFSGEQKAIYEIVLAAQLAAIEKVTPAYCFNDYHLTAIEVLTQGLLDLGLLNGDVSGLIEQQAYRKFYMHRTGHWLGLDVHDVGDYQLQGSSRPLQSNMVVTVEPGLYISDVHDDIDPRWHGIGVRIEDDVVVGTEPEVITHEAVKSVADIEALMAD